MKSETSIPQDIEMRDKDNPCVFMDISVDGTYAGKMVIELYKDTWPKVAENFRALCTGEKGKGKTGKPLHYKDTVFYRISKNILAEGGDIEKNNGSGGESIYGGYFKVDNDRELAPRRGMLYMAHCKEEIGSNFFIALDRCFYIASFCAVVGKVIQGLETLDKIEQEATDTGCIITKLIKIIDCDEIPRDKVSNKGEKKNSRKRAISSDDETDGPVFQKQRASTV